MRRLLLTSAALALAAAPAFAATNTPAGPQMNQSGMQSGSGNDQSSGQNGSALRQKITQDLSQAGFSDVHVMPESFLVRAKDKAGNPVMMVINPDSVTAITETPGQTGGNQTAQGGGGSAMGTSTMNDSAHAGNAINAPNGNGTTTAR